jgi:pyruvate dehydrogenase E2 component (dihydrolipoamide acetyltransferase)
MAEPIVLPKAGLTMEDATVVQWLVAVGESVVAGQPVVEIETYKATIELDAPIDGVLRATVETGQTVAVGTIIGIVAGADEDIAHLELGAVLPGAVDADETPEAVVGDEPAGSGPQPPAPRQRDSERSASPAARRRAHELGVDLSEVEGTGPGGRVRVEDVERAAAGEAA